ncbi:neutral zinc metallopeptidase [Actinokineospora globicatena]|uniref:neutral zinc metallopeptidase n=1 Tax=Actinokineospora globicatena TaxID=103729 RepID=UPI0020A56BD3|nr:neutral zinc metallopeptidase [Actinokineospora globicatena]GLW81302.1 aminopeptidase [Actinokineospora globicatena]GLW88000.1 aminopeptidase [Actinokineospora globicatena]
MRTHSPGDLARLLPALIAVFALLACTTTVPGQAVGQGGVAKGEGGTGSGVDVSFVHNTDGGDIDRLAATVVTDVQAYWTATFPPTFGKDYAPLKGGFYSVDTADADSKAPPCANKATEVEGNAFYCPDADVIAWDRAALLPVLRDRFGEAAVMLVLAHEMGHAVQDRTGSGIDERKADPARYPTILIEAMADCYAGSFVRWVVDGKAAHLTIAKDRLDTALESLISFRDPIGTEQQDRGAHGDAFDRVSAFQDGYEQGAATCSKMTVDNRVFTLSGFIDAGDQARGGNLEFAQMVESVTLGLDGFYAALLPTLGKQWTAPKVVESSGPPTCDGTKQGPVAYCPVDKSVQVDVRKELPELHADIGDYATGTLIASRYGLAALAAAGKPLKGADAQRSVNCLAGAFTLSLFVTRPRLLSPGDLDEAVQVLLDYDYAARDVDGAAPAAGFDRVRAFRQGFTEGAQTCGLS